MVVLAGSHAYGMETDESDIDINGIIIPPSSIRDSLFNRFEQYKPIDWLFQNNPITNNIRELLFQKTKKSITEDICEGKIFALDKVMKIISDANPNMLELLFVDENDILHFDERLFRLRENRELFLSLRLRFTYLGYATSQLNKIKRHRSFILEKPPNKPTRKEYGLPEFTSILNEGDKILVDKAISDLIKDWYIQDLNIDDSTKRTLLESMRKFFASTLQCSDFNLDIAIKDLAASSIGLPEDVRHILIQENKYKAALKNYDAYQHWLTDRNPKRKEMEERFGFDLKHAVHLLRLSRTCVELLETGQLNVRRPDSEELKGIRRGERTFDDICEENNNLILKAENLYKENPCKLPHKANFEKIDQLYIDLINQ